MMMRITSGLIAACTFAIPLSAGSDDKIRSLFNGKDLSGWDGNPAYWSVRDGAITGENPKEGGTPQNTFLIWRGGVLRDFDLRAKWKITGAGGNSGIQFRSKELPEAGKWVVGGYQADLDTDNQYTGIGYEERGRSIFAQPGERVVLSANAKPKVMETFGDPAKIRARVRTGKWNDYRIEARGNRVVEHLNGERSVEWVDEDPNLRALEGILAFQLHSGPPMVVQFKEIRLRTR